MEQWYLVSLQACNTITDLSCSPWLILALPRQEEASHIRTTAT